MIMDTKKLLLLLTVMVTASCIFECDGKAALRRKPKVYNALITTDDNLVQSRAFPVIQPTIHESGIAHYHPFGPYNPYGIYNPHLVRFGQPIAPNLSPKEQLPYPLPPPQYQPQYMGQPLGPQPYPGYPLPQAPPTGPAEAYPEESQPPPTSVAAEEPASTVQPPTMLMAAPAPEAPKNPNQVEKMPSEQLPIPLNEYGYPPALISPLRQPYGPAPNANRQPAYLPPYGFQQFPPFFYKNLPGLRQQFLPPYDYLPTGPQFPLSNTIPTDKTYPLLPAPAAPQAPQLTPAQVAPTLQPTLPQQQPTEPLSQASEEPEPTFENIKNGSKSADNNVPDVPPPPIPSGAKSKQS